MENQGKVFRILSIDGGGVRGIIPAQILLMIEKGLGINIYNTFDLIVGTSTGSIIAAAIALQYKLEGIVKDYQSEAKDIFKKKWYKKVKFTKCLSKIEGLYKSKYSSAPLERFLWERLKDITLGEIDKPLIINATNVSQGEVYVFKSSYQRDTRGDAGYQRDGETPLYKAVLASCAAPTYFDPVDIDGTLVCDGSIWANNPAIVGYAEALDNFKIDKGNIRILSLGTGSETKVYHPTSKWGVFSGWKGSSQLVDFLMSCQTQFPQNALEVIDSEMILRINPRISPSGECDYPIDGYENIPELTRIAKVEFTKRASEIKRFLS